ncbi:MAG: DUF7144 family membrane protein [Gaiella sp.]
MSMAAAPGRPVSTTIVAVIAFIQGIIATLAGIGLIVERNNDSLIEHIGQSTGQIQAYGWAAVIWGVLALLVGWGLWSGGNWARALVAILQALHIGGGIYLLFAWNGHYLWQGIWQIAVGAFVLWLLFNPRSEEFFAGR